MRPKTRFNIVVLLGLLFWVLILYTLYGPRLRIILEEESIGYILNALPGGPTFLFGCGAIALLFLIVFLVVMNRRVFPRPHRDGQTGPGRRPFIASLGTLFLFSGCYLVWSFQPGPRPQELTGAIAIVAGISLFLFAFVSTTRRLLLTHLVFFAAASVMVISTQFAPGHRDKVAVLRDRMEATLLDLERIQNNTNLVDPDDPIEAAAERAEKHLIYRFDEHLGRITQTDAPEFSPGTVVLDEIPTDSRFAASGYEKFDDEIRKVLLVAAPCTLTYAVTVPEVNPRLFFGVAAKDSGDPTTFEVTIRHGGFRQTVFSKTLTGTPKWSDHRLDLGRWRGQKVEVSFETTADSRTLAVWSNPVLLGEPLELPNVVIFLNDALRADHLGAYGYDRDTSPSFDRLATEGVLFERAFSNGTTTLNSIPSLFSSNPITSTGVRDHGEVLPEEFPTLTEILRTMGYATAAFTANPIAGPYSGTHQGFSTIFTTTRIARQSNQAGGDYSVDAPDAEFLIGDLMNQWIEMNSDRNFFLYIHTMDSHGVYDPPASHRHFYEKSASETPVHWDREFDPRWLETPTRESRLGLYDGEIAYGDIYLERFLDMLEAHGLLENTLFIFLADHGEYFGEHGLWGHRPPAFVQGTHIPLIIAGPGVPAGVRIAGKVQILDIMPTILDVVGMQPDHLLYQGQSLLPLARGESSPGTGTRSVFVEGDRGGRLTFHCGDFHLLPERNLIFDLSEDPEEANALNEFVLDFSLKSLSRDVIDKYRETYMRLGKTISPMGGQPRQIDPDTLERLRTLGYIK